MAKDFFSKTQQDQIIESIKIAEKNTSGEIQLHVEEYCKQEPIERAIEVFSYLGIHKTELKNGVLFYLAVVDKKFAIIGDEGINNVVPNDFWETIKSEMKLKFKEGMFCEGICEAIIKAGEQLKIHFPYKANDSNELSDEISFGQ